MSARDRLEAWLKADEECPPVLYRPQATTTIEVDESRAFDAVRRELRRVGRLLLEVSAKLDALRWQTFLPSLVVPVHTPRLTLRDFVEGDFDAIRTYASDPEVTRFMFHGPRTPEDTRDYLNRMLASQREAPRLIWELGVVVTAANRLVGACDLTCDGRGEGDLGFILSKDVWGMGYATEAARAMVRAGFEQLGLIRIAATCDVSNGASARVLEKAGLRRTATLERHKHALGKWWTSFFYEIELER